MKKLSELTQWEKFLLCIDALGWEDTGKGWERKLPNGTCVGWTNVPPNYGASRDAMAEAERSLTMEESELYVDALARIVNPVHGYRHELNFANVTANAQQRLDAFLVAKGLAKLNSLKA